MSLPDELRGEAARDVGRIATAEEPEHSLERGPAERRIRRVLGFAFPTLGTVIFDLEPAGSNNYSATGTLAVKKQTDGSVAYQANLGGGYGGGTLNLTFTATNNTSSGTMTATLAGNCFPDGIWTISGIATSGSGTWSACR